MCRLCKTNPVYEFTNQRKLCKTCFIHYFEKKVLYTIRRFKMIQSGDVVGYKTSNDFKGVVLESILRFLSKKSGLKLVKFPNTKANKIANTSSLDVEANNIVNSMIKRNSIDLKKEFPVEKNTIKPLYLFLDEEILLYAKLKGLKFNEIKIKKDNIKIFLDEFEKKHPEVKRAVVNSLLELYYKN